MNSPSEAAARLRDALGSYIDQCQDDPNDSDADRDLADVTVQHLPALLAEVERLREALKGAVNDIGTICQELVHHRTVVMASGAVRLNRVIGECEARCSDYIKALEPKP